MMHGPIHIRSPFPRTLLHLDYSSVSTRVLQHMAKCFVLFVELSSFPIICVSVCNAAGEPDYSLCKLHSISSIKTNEERQTSVRYSRRVEEREKHVGSERRLYVKR